MSKEEGDSSPVAGPDRQMEVPVGVPAGPIVAVLTGALFSLQGCVPAYTLLTLSIETALLCRTRSDGCTRVLGRIVTGFGVNAWKDSPRFRVWPGPNRPAIQTHDRFLVVKMRPFISNGIVSAFPALSRAEERVHSFPRWPRPAPARRALPLPLPSSKKSVRSKIPDLPTRQSFQIFSFPCIPTSTSTSTSRFP